MISEQILMFSSFVENAVEYYRNLLLLIILKGFSSSFNLQALLQTIYIYMCNHIIKKPLILT